MKKSDKLKQEMQAKWADIEAIRQSVVKEEREFSPDETKSVENALDDARKLELQIKAEEQQEALIDEIDAFSALFEQKSTAAGPARPVIANGPKAQKALSLGQAFVKSEEWQGYKKAIAPNGRIPDSMKGISSPPVQFTDLGLFKQKALTITGSDATSAGAFVVSDRTDIYEPLGRFPLTLRDLIAVRTTGSDTVEFVRQLTQVTQAAAVPEANVTDYTGATGQVSGVKPQGGMTFERVTETVKTIAVWVAATKRALADAGQLSGLINQELIEALNEELEDQILNGNGVGENLTGLSNTANTLVQAFDTDIVKTSRKAITNLLINGKQQPTAWLMYPSDWERFDLMQDGQQRYYWGGPLSQGPPTLWGVPVAQSFYLTAGGSWLGNWRKAVLWDREMANISVSDSHSDFFIRNMVAVLAELRAAFGVIRPSAFVEVDLVGGT
jgi:HK97 family phage major capsid protein